MLNREEIVSATVKGLVATAIIGVIGLVYAIGNNEVNKERIAKEREEKARIEHSSLLEEATAKADLNGNGVIDLTELAEVYHAVGKKYNPLNPETEKLTYQDLRIFLSKQKTTGRN